MFTLTITLPLFVVVLILIGGVALGYAIRGSQRLKMRTRIEELEAERHSSNSRILELEKETLELESHLREWKSPVIPIKKTAGPVIEEKPTIASRDMSLRKQLLGKDDKNRHSASR
jgi:hypothetical protein